MMTDSTAGRPWTPLIIILMGRIISTSAHSTEVMVETESSVIAWAVFIDFFRKLLTVRRKLFLIMKLIFDFAQTATWLDSNHV